MSPSVLWTTLATPNPMGQQHYEVRIQEALLALAGDDWEFASSTVSSLRNPVAADARFPMQILQRASVSVAVLAGRVRYPPSDLVHRFDLRIPPGRRPEIVTAHDLPPLRFGDEGVLPRFSVASARRAAGVICPSRFAADEIRDLCQVERIWVIPYGLSAEFQDPKPLDEEELGALGISGRYVVHAAGVTERKNLVGLAEAWRLLDGAVDDVTLILCGAPHPRRNHLFAGLPRVALPGKLPPSMVARLMAGAAAVVVPSTYEGFGLPALEGMASGAPVVAAACGALPEVCGQAAALVEPTGSGLADGLFKVLSDSALADRLIGLGRARARDFDWGVAARAHLDVYREVLGE